MHKYQKTLTFFLCGLFTLIPLASCNIFSSGETRQKTTLAETVFDATLTEPLKENEVLYLELLDEVTGLALNPTRYEMVAKDNLSYYVRVPLVIGSLIKYRYIRQGSDGTLIEHDTNGEVLQYRLNLIKKPSVVNDFIAAWDAKSYQGKTGEVSGYVYDLKTEAPLGEVMLCLNGMKTLSSSDGFYDLKNIPLGEYNLIAFQPDGEHQTFQQAAVIAENSVTPASFGMETAHSVKVTFVVTPPQGEETKGEMRLISSLYTQGNTMSEQAGGVSVLAYEAPALIQQSNGTYTLSLEIPVGFDLQYKFSMGDGFLNAERAGDGGYKTRQFIVPGHDTKIRNTVESWYSQGSSPVTFNLTVPANTPANDTISIQFNPFVWMEPIPMKKTGDRQWSFTLYGPQEYLNGAQFRFCRNSQCGLADDALTSGPTASGYILNLDGAHSQPIGYAMEKWAGLEQKPYTFATINIPANNIYIKAVQMSTEFGKKDMSSYKWGIVNAAVNGANMLLLTPTWTFPSTSVNEIAPKTGSDLLESDLDQVTALTNESGLTLGIFPQPRFTTGMDDYWYKSERSFNWWNAWFDRYEHFILNYADYAELNKIQTLVIGGLDVASAFPVGKLPNGNSAETPYNAADIWSGLIDKVRSRFSGQLFFALPYSSKMDQSYDFLKKVDAIYVEMDTSLTTSNSPSLTELKNSVSGLLDSNIYQLYANYQKPIILGMDYLSVDGSAANCLSFSSSCREFLRAQSNPLTGVDLEEQALVYQAIMEEAIQRNWIYGLVSEGYNPSVMVEDHSASIYGKPAGVVLSHYFSSLVK